MEFANPLSNHKGRNSFGFPLYTKQGQSFCILQNEGKLETMTCQSWNVGFVHQNF